MFPRNLLLCTKPIDRQTALKKLAMFGLGKGFDVVAFLEPVERSQASRDVSGENGYGMGPAITVLRNDRVYSLPLTYPIESWPIAAQSAESRDPFIWTPNEPRYFTMSRLAQLRQVAVRAFFRRFGVEGAVTTPVHTGDEKFGFVTWFSCSLGPSAVEDWTDMFGELQRAASEFLNVFPTLTPGSPGRRDFGLSQRQIECLRWAALGKTNDEIAELIGRSAETVRFHLKKSTTKLNANNRIHAIAVASYLQLLGDIGDLPG
jgi:DNA-binding CsgD family transcriptional regulator